MTNAFLLYLRYLEDQVRRREPLQECDYSKLMAISLPQFFAFPAWFIVPEFVLEGTHRPDYLVGRILPNGLSYHHVVVETKNSGAVSWQYLMRVQVWDQCDAAKNDNGKIFCICLIGFHLCFFTFDISEYQSSEWFTNFSPLNLNGFDEFQLRNMGLEPIVESIANDDIIQTIPWNFSNPMHRPYIIQSFTHMVNNMP